MGANPSQAARLFIRVSTTSLTCRLCPALFHCVAIEGLGIKGESARRKHRGIPNSPPDLASLCDYLSARVWGGGDACYQQTHNTPVLSSTGLPFCRFQLEIIFCRMKLKSPANNVGRCFSVIFARGRILAREKLVVTRYLEPIR